MALPRESAFMPTIKCSSCGNQVEISMMGDHICGGAAAPEPMPPLPSKDTFSQPPRQENKFGARMAPPTVDTGAANRPFLGPGQMTPISTSTGSQSVSPKTPGPGRSDEFFQPQIASDYSTTPQNSRRPGGYGGFDEPDTFGSDPGFGQPTSPQRKQSNAFSQKMNAITPGPFDVGRKPSVASARNQFAPPPRKQSNTVDETPFVSSNLSSSPESTEPPPMLSLSPKTYQPPNMSYGPAMPATPATPSTADGFAFLSHNHTGIAPPSIPRKNGYGGFGASDQASNNLDVKPPAPNRSGTFPRPSERVESPMRTPSAPGARPDRLQQLTHEGNGHGRQPSTGPDRSRAPPPRTSLLRPSTSGRDAPRINLAEEFGVGNPYHSPSDSASSGYSTFSRQGDASSQSSSSTSPVKSKDRNRRQPSDTSNFDNLMNDLESEITGMNFGGEQNSSRSPPDARANPFTNRPPMADLRYDPAVQGGGPPDRTRSPLATPSSKDRDVYGQNLMQPPPPRSASAPPSKGPCKSCGKGIQGKSISSADGRLTGRYHKACFVCTTCREPFTSAEFYVLNDKPFCELHYHKLNGSLCGSCGRGIEGQYLEDEDMVKYHVGCFRCGDCGMSLSNGYFEVNGKSYCERDAWKRVQQPWMNNGGGPGGPGGPAGPPPPEGPSRNMARSPAPPGSTPGRHGPGGMGMRPGMGPAPGMGGPRAAVGLPRGQRLPPGASLGAPMPTMNKRSTRLGMMGVVA